MAWSSNLLLRHLCTVFVRLANAYRGALRCSVSRCRLPPQVLLCRLTQVDWSAQVNPARRGSCLGTNPKLELPPRRRTGDDCGFSTCRVVVDVLRACAMSANLRAYFHTYTTTLRVIRRLGEGRESCAAVTRVIRNSLVHSAPILLQFVFASSATGTSPGEFREQSSCVASFRSTPLA